MKQVDRVPLKYHGGKSVFAPHIHALAEPLRGLYKHRAIAYAGGLGEFWNWDYEGISEAINDKDGRITNLWDVLKDPQTYELLKRRLEFTPFSQVEWGRAHELAESGEHTAPGYEKEDRVLLAWAMFVNIRQSLSGRCEDFTSVTKTRVRRGMNDGVSAWISSIEGLYQVHRRLWRVLVQNKPAVDFILEHDAPGTLFYLDPPYVPQTRVSRKVYGGRDGKFEMTLAEHAELLEVLVQCQGYVILSGYANGLYDVALRQWGRKEYHVKDCASMAVAKRDKVEVLWFNFPKLAA